MQAATARLSQAARGISLVNEAVEIGAVEDGALALRDIDAGAYAAPIAGAPPGDAHRCPAEEHLFGAVPCEQKEGGVVTKTGRPNQSR